MPKSSLASTGKKRLSLSDVVDDVREMKVVFAQRPGLSGAQRHAPSSPTPPPPPPPPPPPAAGPVAPHSSSSRVSASTTSQGDVCKTATTAAAAAMASQDVEDDIFFTIAPPTRDVESGETTWEKSASLSLDEEIEKARASRPLVRSPDALNDENARLKLNVKGDYDEGASEGPVDKESLKSLPQEEAATIDLHEIPDVISERAHVPERSEATQMPDQRRDSQQLGSQERDVEVKERPPLKDSRTEEVVVEQPPSTPWTNTIASDGERGTCLKVSFDDESSLGATILLQESPAHVMAAVNALHEAITEIEDRHGSTASVTYVMITALPTLSFFEPKKGPLELSCAERVDLLRAKERLFQRLVESAQRLRFVAVVHCGIVCDFGAELFLACHHRVLLDPARTTFGFKSIRVGDFPAACVVRRLRYCLGSQRTIELAPRMHEYSAESLVDAGLAECARSVQEVVAMLPGLGERSVDTPASSFLLWLERTLLLLLPRPTQRELVLRKLFFTYSFDKSMVVSGQNPLLHAWVRYSMAAITQGNGTSETIDDKASRRQKSDCCASIFSDMAYSSPSTNAASVHAMTCAMQRRVLPALPGPNFVTFRGEEINLWPQKIKALSSTEGDRATVLLDCSQRCIGATVQLVNDHREALKDTRVVLIGEEHVARQLVVTLPCSAVVSCASPYRASALEGLQEVRLFARDSWPANLRHNTLVAALTYLQAQRRPYVVCRGSCGKRLLAAVATEACRMALQCDVTCVERAATDMLGLLVGPFRLIDHFGAAAVLQMMDDTAGVGDGGNPLQVDCLPAVGRHALQCMSADGLLGVHARRGGFYTYRDDGTAVGFNAEVQRRYLRRRLTDAEVADRLLAVIINECCALLLSGCVQCAADANALSVATIGFRETTGGALALADARGIAMLVQKMEDLSEWHGPHLRPSLLLKCMAHSSVSFASLSEATIQSARM
ncbi:3-hydroxyacyl-CoA dehydrogenase [Trypanosoma grayi]|uniref:3-hydroxyacyl-CoA dehydrogenase n=1 Tax=Trypanosoma grayi TaxID=71804 RepID=UPI0004F49EA9|nr:3-hydroxyacyl-CoA dehydrogenase [Trypanosoma grayi]KEG08655.1 3-hydroxyacyl-CoA dehydrogenase [Trypanosoma grayi]